MIMITPHYCSRVLLNPLKAGERIDGIVDDITKKQAGVKTLVDGSEPLASWHGYRQAAEYAY
ncbi:MAG UNVERIFIED_CONTAM: hypothetical protein LVR18_12620 [Planctomycetaceae bacterium]|jgi:hypothetical protein